MMTQTLMIFVVAVLGLSLIHILQSIQLYLVLSMNIKIPVLTKLS